jgi:(hydroxyamino)benzene mutase
MALSTLGLLGLNLIKNGSLLVTTGLCWGTVIPATPFPRIALSTHLTLIQHGLLNIAAGTIVRTGLSELNEWQIWMVAVPHYLLWGVHACGMANAWCGSDKTWKIVHSDCNFCKLNFRW